LLIIFYLEVIEKKN